MCRALGAIVLLVLWMIAETPVAGAPAPSPKPLRRGASLRMLATAYCERGATKSGVPAQPGVVAADVRHLPLGTRLEVIAPGQPYAGVYTVLDTGSKIRGHDLDIFMSSCGRARRFGKRSVLVRILRQAENSSRPATP
jgi:3D (Asp-Asp-Asp) domain-containing protein